MFLYKYMSAEKFERMITNETIRFTPPSEFNDPFEFLPHIDGFENEHNTDMLIEESLCREMENTYKKFNEIGINLKNFSTMRDIYKPIMAKMIKDYLLNMQNVFQSLCSKLGVLCLSSEKDNILMWSHYADSHKGVVVIFDTTNNFFKKIPGPLGEIRAVTYSDIRPKVNIESAFNHELFYVKASAWSYEKEYRLIYPLIPNFDCEWVDMKKGICKIPLSIVNGIIFGAKCPPKTKAALLDKLKTTGKLDGINIYYAALNGSTYAIDIYSK